MKLKAKIQIVSTALYYAILTVNLLSIKIIILFHLNQKIFI
jgi:hypothetical protein